MNIKNFWMVLAVALVSLCAVSCGDDDDNGGTKENPTTSADPEGTIVANLTNNEKLLRIGDVAELYLNSSNNLWVYGAQIVCVGSVKGLSSIKKVPESGWSRETAAIPGYGYVIEGNRQGGYSWFSGTARLYVVDYMRDSYGGIMGCTVKYQFWDPESK